MIGTSKSIWGFDPRSIPGCIVWLDGGDSNTMTPATPSGGTSITAWRDKSVNGVSYASGAVPTYPGCNIAPPTYVTGGGLNFNPSIPGGSTFTNNVTQGLSAVGGFPLNATGFTAFAVAVATGTMTSFNSYFSYAAGAPQFIDFNAGGGTFGQIITDTTGLNVTISATRLTTTRQIQSVRSSTTGATFFVNGSLSNTTAFNYTQVNNPLATVVWIGNQAPGFRSFSGTIFELLVYNQSLSSNQRQTVEGYLARKWAITLATTHPFFVLPPFNRYFNPIDVPACSLWLDGADGSSLRTAPTYAANSGVVTTLAGNASAAFADGTGAGASFSSPIGVAVIPSSGLIVVGDTFNNRIRLITQAGVVTTLAGSGTATFADGTGTAASFSGTWGVAVIPSTGDIVVADRNNNRIRLVTPTGVVTTLAGSGTAIFADGTGAAASFSLPAGIAVIPSSGTIVVADTGNNRIRLVTYPGGVVTTLAGSGTAAFADGTGGTASFNGPIGVAVIPSSSVIVVSDSGNNRIRLVTQAGVVTTLAGQATAGNADGTGAAAAFNLQRGVAVASTGQIVVADYNNQRVRVVTTSTYAANSGVVTTLAGSSFGFADGTGTGASFFALGGVAVNPSNGVIVVADMLNNRIRLITSSTINTTWNDKSGLNNNVTGTATWTGSNVSFNGTTNALSNLTYVFPISAYSMFAVYSNTTAPAAGAYMNAVYGSNGFPMLGTFDVGRNVSARSVVANTGALAVPVGWAARITDFSYGYAGATDLSNNAIIGGNYNAAGSVFNASGTTFAALPFTTGASPGFVAKYSSLGVAQWVSTLRGGTAASVRGLATDTSANILATGLYIGSMSIYNSSGTLDRTLTNASTSGSVFIIKYTADGGIAWAAQNSCGSTINTSPGSNIATDSSGSVFVTGSYSTTLTLYNTDGGIGTTLTSIGGTDAYVAKYSSTGTVLWAARIGSTSGDSGTAVATDSSGNVFVTGVYNAAVTLYNTGGGIGATLALAGSFSCFIAKYSSAGTVLWAAHIGTANGFALATDSSGSVFVTGQYNAAMTLFNTGGTPGAALGFTGGSDIFLAKYSSAGAVLWAAQIAGTTTNNDVGYAVATDALGNVFVTGFYAGAVTLYNTGGGIGATLGAVANNDTFVAKYSSTGTVLWAARIAGTGQDYGFALATDSSGSVFVFGAYSSSPLTLLNKDGTTARTLTFGTTINAFVAKYSPDGFINAPTPASSNVLVSATYTPSTFSPFVNGFTQTTLAGTTLATTGIFVGGPSNYFNGTISELLIYSANLSAAQRQQVEGYLIDKWRLSAQTVVGHQYRLIPPTSVLPFQPTGISTPLIWFDAADRSTISFSSGSVISTWSNKGSSAAHATARTGSLTSGVTTFNGLNIVNCPASANLGFTMGIPSQPRAWFAVFRMTSQLTTTGLTQYFVIVNQTTGGGQDSFAGPLSPTNIAANTYTLAEGPSGIVAGVSTATAPNGLNVMSQYGLINSAVSTASNFVMVNGSAMTLTISTLASGYKTVSALYEIGDRYGGSGADIAEIMMFNTEMTTRERQQIEGYIGWKWGIARTLPTTHPFYNYPPALA